MASLKKLAGQTVWYGLSNIAAKLLNYILTPLVTYLLNSPQGQVDYGDYSVIYAAISFVNIVYTYGLETAYFRFASASSDHKKLFQTTFTSLLVSTVILSPILYLLRVPINNFLGLGAHPEYISWAIAVIALDTLSVIPFAKLRQEERPRKYAFTKVAGVILNILLTIFFIYYSPEYVLKHPGSAYAHWYKQYDNTGFLVLANLAQSALTFLLLWKEWLGYRFKFDGELWRKVMWYCSPMIVTGLGGMVNETIDRIMLRKLLPVSADAARTAVAIYGANYKIAIFVTLFIQAFRMSAEPFFFSQSSDKNAPKTYARVMKWFVITLCIAFLFTALYLDIWKYMVGSDYRKGLGVVPILLCANVALGIYYNLNVWYKITDRMRIGMYITLVGATLTLILNFAFIPKYGMYACAWATLAAYGSMMVISYFVGQKFFPVPYNVKKLLAYLTIMLLLFFVEKGVVHLTHSFIIRVGAATILMFLFLYLVFTVEKKELRSLPFVGKLIR
ncbi:MAG TPA: oligosaccharide flippase family protein [Flavipsychrobacter sp.]|nr:oligosaccharide flippase family protein [Flavipsychrobacter sp.]